MIISHTFTQQWLWKRWKMLADNHPDVEVTLISPDVWVEGKNKNYTFGTIIETHGKNYDSERFHVRTVDMKTYGAIGWVSQKIKNEIKALKPDFIFHIGTHLQDSLVETICLKKLYCKHAKVLAFSMRGPQHNLKKNSKGGFKHLLNYEYRKKKLKYVRKNVAAIYCHYPDAKELFIKEGFKEPIYIQTQVGVDTTIFKPNEEYRRQIRKQYNLGDSYVFGSAVRLTSDKGVMEVIEALPQEGNWKYLLMGNGTDSDVQAINEAIKKKKIEDKVILTGFINSADMPIYWNAVDCAVHVPRSTENWVETFSLALVQAMATQLCVIGNTSGSVPYQIGNDGIIVPENDVEKLRDTMQYVLDNPHFALQNAVLMRKRAEECFDIKHLSECFYKSICDIQKGVKNPDHFDMANGIWDN